MDPNVNAGQGTLFSQGDNTANGTRFDIKESNTGAGASLRVEVQGAGANSNPTNFGDGSWHFVAVTVPSTATFASVSWYVDGSSTNLNKSISTQSVLNGASSLVLVTVP